MKTLWSKLRAWFGRLTGRYEGAAFSTSRSYLPASVQDARLDISATTRLELVRKSRYFERNSAIVNRLADLFECYTVGAAGLQILPASTDLRWNSAAQASFEQWSNVCDLTSLHTFGTLQSLCARAWFIDGEIFILKTRGPSSPARPRIQLIEAHRIETPPALRDQEGKSINDGIALSSIGRPIGYYIREGDGAEATWRRIDAENIIHIFEPSRPGQYRGLPFIYPVINDLHDLDDLQRLEMMAAKDAAEVSNIIKTKSGEIDSGTLRRARLGTSTLDSQGNAVAGARIEHYREVLGGRTVALQKDEELEQFRSERPSVASREYWEYLTTKICAGVGISKLLVFPDSKQGTVARAELDIANAFFRARSAVLAAAFTRVWIYVLGWGIKTELSLADPPADWARVASRPPRSVNVDVGRNSAAMLAELKAGATNFDLVYGPLGLDGREQLRIAADYALYIRQLAEERGITPGEIAGSIGEAIATLEAATVAATADLQPA